MSDIKNYLNVDKENLVEIVYELEDTVALLERKLAKAIEQRDARIKNEVELTERIIDAYDDGDPKIIKDTIDLHILSSNKQLEELK